ncbi:MAG TPA: hypothetical protein VGD64_14560 [Acidisarcina sp.]
MRTTLAIEDDAYEVASVYAKAKGITLGTAVSELVRKAIEPEPKSPSPRLKMGPDGFLVIRSTGRVITSEMVKEALEEE